MTHVRHLKFNVLQMAYLRKKLNALKLTIKFVLLYNSDLIIKEKLP
jgi:hypothetical protein